MKTFLRLGSPWQKNQPLRGHQGNIPISQIVAAIIFELRTILHTPVHSPFRKNPGNYVLMVKNDGSPTNERTKTNPKHEPLDNHLYSYPSNRMCRRAVQFPISDLHLEPGADIGGHRGASNSAGDGIRQTCLRVLLPITAGLRCKRS